MHVDGDANGRATLAVDLDVGEGGAQEMSTPVGMRKPRAMAMALTAWFTAPAPTHWMLTGPVLDHSSNGTATEAGETYWIPSENPCGDSQCGWRI